MLERMTEYYRDNPEVEVIMDRRDGGIKRPPPGRERIRRQPAHDARPQASARGRHLPRIDGPV